MLINETIQNYSFYFETAKKIPQETQNQNIEEESEILLVLFQGVKKQTAALGMLVWLGSDFWGLLRR